MFASAFLSVFFQCASAGRRVPAPGLAFVVPMMVMAAAANALPPHRASAAAADTLTVTQAQLGNVFARGENVTIPVQTTGDTVEWSVRDFYGTASSGTAVPVGADHTAVIHPAPAAGLLGYFELHLNAKRAGNTVAQADTTFAVLAPVDVTTMDDSPFGVMTHFAQGWDTDLIPLIARAGLRHIRDEHYWATVEPQRGQYVFNDGYTAYMAAAATGGLDPLMELTFDNNQYDHDPANPAAAWAPCTDDGRLGYANYAAALLARYPAQIKTLEVWNEYNGGWCNGPAAANKPVFYTQMLQATYSLVKKTRPDVRVIGGAAVLTPLPWFEDLFAAGALDSMDAAVCHPYVGLPEDAGKDMTALQDLMARYNHGNGPKPIWATECGQADPSHPGRQDMARYLVRLLTVLRSTGVERIHWYLMRDYNDFVTGLLHSDRDPLGRYVPTSAYPAYANLVQQLYHAQFVRREATDLRTRAYLFSQGGNELRVLWSTDIPSHLVLMTQNPLAVTDLMGNTRVLQPQDGAVALVADNNPVYVQGAVTAIHETGRDLLLADSLDGFGGTQGTAPGTWAYGYYHQGDSPAYRPVDFRPMVWSRTSWGYQWQCDYPWATVGSYGMSPGDQNYRAVWSIRRWLSNTAGTVRITGTVGRGSSQGDGTGAKVLVDGVEMYGQLIGGAGAAGSGSFDFTATLKTGSTVDFVVTPGPTDDINFDSVDFRAQVTQPAAVAPITYNDWQQEYFTAAQLADPTMSGATADFPADTMSNLLRYAFGIASPAMDLTAYQPQMALQALGDACYLTLTFRRLLAAVDLQYVVELTNSLTDAAWSPDGVLVGSPTDNGDGTETVTYRDSLAIAEAAQRFIRLRVVRQ